MKELKILKPDAYKIDIDGKAYFLRYDMNAFSLMEEKFGSVEEALKSLEAKGKGQLDTVLNIFYFGLCADSNFKMTFEELKSCIGLSSVEGIVNIVVDSLNTSLPEATKAVKGGKSGAKN